MSKQKTRTIIKPVGVAQPKAYSFCKEQSSNRASIQGDPHFEEIAKNNKGITLIALIITIIVMLILVGVSVTVALNGGLFSTAQKATSDTELEKDKELALSDGTIEVDGKEYLSAEDYVAGIEKASEIMEGKGTETNPYTIDSIEALVQFAHSVTNGKTYEGEYVKLTRNLDFKSTDSYIDATRTDYEEYGYTGELITALTTGEGWLPIGSTADEDKETLAFRGDFEGNNCSISNLYINKRIESGSNYQYYGLFSANYGIIKNLTVTGNIEINATQSNIAVGEIAGIVFSGGIIQNCTSYGNVHVTGTEEMRTYIAAGGIAGQLYTGRVEKCKSDVSVSGGSFHVYLGGIIGNNYKGSIYNSYNTGKILSEKYNGITVRVGGIAGHFERGVIDYCFNIGEVISEGNVGGIVGFFLEMEGTYAEITNCVYSNSTVNGVGNYSEDNIENENIKIEATKNEKLTENDILINIL